MYSRWDNDVIQKGLECLTESEKELFNYDIDLKERCPTTKPPVTIYKKFGFASLSEYNDSVAHLMTLVRNSFGSMGLTSVNDLEFDTPGTSTDGKRIPPKPIKRKTPKTAV
jgi:hypothetical protein